MRTRTGCQGNDACAAGSATRGPGQTRSESGLLPGCLPHEGASHQCCSTSSVTRRDEERCGMTRTGRGLSRWCDSAGLLELTRGTTPGPGSNQSHRSKCQIPYRACASASPGAVAAHFPRGTPFAVEHPRPAPGQTGSNPTLVAMLRSSSSLSSPRH